ncbi:YMGG-like glycine zipper-containing protein [Dongia soli]|uniref:Glycine zipper domain-containing protein n=1 Tax=Dongia soli TaxID=600628 RepID=A0ABU5EF69_9PROT|nr:YMGG-like glycine zipper-containing protein [Dongia soli]MDY0884572.1 glycine zipper domain-containing protein [Dongia soli]
MQLRTGRVQAGVATILLSACLTVTGCTGMSDTQQRTVTGAMGGAAGGALIGAIAGNAALGAAIGAAAGGVGGFVWDQHKQSEDAAFQRGVAAGGQTTD